MEGLKLAVQLLAHAPGRQWNMAQYLSSCHPLGWCRWNSLLLASPWPCLGYCCYSGSEIGRNSLLLSLSNKEIYLKKTLVLVQKEREWKSTISVAGETPEPRGRGPWHTWACFHWGSFMTAACCSRGRARLPASRHAEPSRASCVAAIEDGRSWTHGWIGTFCLEAGEIYRASPSCMWKQVTH